jgi:hypothetical protein
VDNYAISTYEIICQWFYMVNRNHIFACTQNKDRIDHNLYVIVHNDMCLNDYRLLSICYSWELYMYS